MRLYQIQYDYYTTLSIISEVKPGDTLWQIASEHMNKGTDIRKLIYEIKAINSMDDSVIFPGQLIKIPVDSA